MDLEAARRLRNTVGRARRSTVRRAAVAIGEACSWAGLLVGMLFKYVVVLDDIGVNIFGPIHGELFVAYIVITLAVARPLGWGRGTVLLALAASVPPLFTLWFERRATGTGRLRAA